MTGDEMANKSDSRMMRFRGCKDKRLLTRGANIR